MSTPFTAATERLLRRARRAVVRVRPRTDDQLDAWVRTVLGFRVPRRVITTGHTPPFDYLRRSFFEDGGGRRSEIGGQRSEVRPNEPGAPATGPARAGQLESRAGGTLAHPRSDVPPALLFVPGDMIVWAARGSGKTQLGAIATLLDLVFKPGIQVRILGGSMEQSSRMYRYLREMFADGPLGQQVRGNITGKGLELKNGSRVEVLSASQRAVRGIRVHKLRCDEVELFQSDIWEAAQLTTRSGHCGEHYVRGTIDAMSTMHEPQGMMQRLVESAPSAGRHVMRWSVVDVLERCPAARDCETCDLWEECQGRAKHAAGFVRIDDAIAQKKRVSRPVWLAEMLCEQPDTTNLVYPMFEHAVGGRHVRAFEPPQLGGSAVWLGGIDFGYAGETVFLWAFIDDRDVLHIIDEFARQGWTTDRIIRHVTEQSWPRPKWIGADPAGKQRNLQTGLPTISLWRRAGYAVRHKQIGIKPGLELVRMRLERADGAVRLRIHPRCEHLIKSLATYHYPRHTLNAAAPEKDGPDHACDALRYLIVNLDHRRGRLERGDY